ncbi:MAG: histidine kinase [Gaiellales bacterium]|nr:histidine kinase [Gaiellales bacterium]
MLQTGPQRDVFQDLMSRRVNQVLLASSLYDTFIIREDGNLGELILNEFLELNLRHTSGLTHVTSGARAVELAAADPVRYNLIITAVNVGDMNALELAAQIRSRGLETPVILLAFDGGELNELAATNDLSVFERVFLWSRDPSILLAIVKYTEDRWNVEHDTGEVGVPIVLVIEDNVRYYSCFLPMIYREIIRHSQNVITEGFSLTDKILRMRARPKILLCTGWEEALSYFERYPEEILGVISDVEFPRNGRLDHEAGLNFALKVRQNWPDVAVILQSGREENAAQAQAVGASFLLKGAPSFMEDLRRVIIRRLFLGDFVFRMPDGRVLGSADSICALVAKLREIPAESIRYHADRNHFSRWLRTRTEFELATILRFIRSSEFADGEAQRRRLIELIETARRKQQEGAVVDFDRSRGSAGPGMERIGKGSLGGKARALAFAGSMLAAEGLSDRWPGIHVSVPPCVVLATDVFDAFMQDNDLLGFALECPDNQRIIDRFQRAHLPAEAQEDLARLLRSTDYPLAVRSSSLLEDSQYQPLAGVYRTFMIPNDHADLHLRLRQLVAAIKRVYASTYAQEAKDYFRMTPYLIEEEKMAVIIQRLVGARHAGHFYPEISGVARSLNFYPAPPATAEDGIVTAALGLGRVVVEGLAGVGFVPACPDRLIHLPTTADLLAASQRSFLALELTGSDTCGDPEEEIREVSLGLDVARADHTLDLLASVYDAANDRLYEGLDRPGVPLVTFAPILKQQRFPLAEISSELMRVGARGMNSGVEIEFAVNLTPEPGHPQEFAFLQLRPLARRDNGRQIDIRVNDETRLLCRSSSVLGNGSVDGIHDLLVVDYDRFQRAHSRVAALEIAGLNSQLVAAGVRYILVGVGRWGSADPWLGIPVTWEQISGAQVIVEAGLRDVRVTPSQGSHFFQNLTSFHVGYFTVNADVGQGRLDWDWLAKQPALSEGEYVRHLRFAQPLVVLMNGLRQEGVIFKPGSPAAEEPRLHLPDGGYPERRRSPSEV